MCHPGSGTARSGVTNEHPSQTYTALANGTFPALRPIRPNCRSSLNDHRTNQSSDDVGEHPAEEAEGDEGRFSRADTESGEDEADRGDDKQDQIHRGFPFQLDEAEGDGDDGKHDTDQGHRCGLSPH